ncbi:hypothetical protein A0H81_12057 [Grifola frondosa]|uniref:Transcription factor Iwr1 domain-containing protein n=1 Tax=Grifola frondosa TaxID=5627 RepID=A0A1C7LTN6_GRIFR|nr:hypothetical protein A0H81_12057 [Grifola frondosa]
MEIDCENLLTSESNTLGIDHEDTWAADADDGPTVDINRAQFYTSEHEDFADEFQGPEDTSEESDDSEHSPDEHEFLDYDEDEFLEDNPDEHESLDYDEDKFPEEDNPDWSESSDYDKDEYYQSATQQRSCQKRV